MGIEHLVAGVQDGLKNIEQAVLGAVGHQDIPVGIGHVVIPAQLFADGLAQFLGARGGGVAGHAQVDGFLGCVTDMLGRGKVRLPGPKADDVQPRGFHFLGPGVNAQGHGRGDILATVRYGQSHEKLLLLHFPVFGIAFLAPNPTEESGFAGGAMVKELQAIRLQIPLYTFPAFHATP